MEALRPGFFGLLPPALQPEKNEEGMRVSYEERATPAPPDMILIEHDALQRAVRVAAAGLPVAWHNNHHASDRRQ